MKSEAYKEWIRGVFDRTASDYGQGYNTFFSYFAKGLVEFANVAPSSRILDIATGRGAVIREVAKKGTVVGIDISPNMIEETSKEFRGFPNAHFLCMDAEELKFEDHTFDYVFCAFGIFFVPNITKSLTEIRRVLKPEGKLFLSTWGEDDIYDAIFNEIYGKFGFKVKAIAHNLEDKTTIKTILSDAGFKNIKIVDDQLDCVYPTFEDWFSSLWAHAGRARLEKCSPEQLKELQRELRIKLEPHARSDGLHEILRARYTSATV